MACPEETTAGPSTWVGEDGQEGSGGPGTHLGGGEKGRGEDPTGDQIWNRENLILPSASERHADSGPTSGLPTRGLHFNKIPRLG